MSNLYAEYDKNAGVVTAKASSSSRQKLAYALFLSDEMLSAAREGDWITVEFLDEERRQLLTDDLFEVEGAEAQLLIDAISALIQVNHEISSLAEEVQDSLLLQHNHSQAARKAAQSYKAVATSL